MLPVFTLQWVALGFYWKSRISLEFYCFCSWRTKQRGAPRWKGRSLCNFKWMFAQFQNEFLPFVSTAGFTHELYRRAQQVMYMRYRFTAEPQSLLIAKLTRISQSRAELADISTHLRYKHFDRWEGVEGALTRCMSILLTSIISATKL